MPTLTLIRGLPGAGKSTYAEKVLKAKIIHEADDWFLGPNGYVFCPKELDKAHLFCRLNAEYDLKQGHDVTVCNTFCESWEFVQYFHLISQYDTRIIELQTNYGSIHNVPEISMERMRNRFQSRETIEQKLGFVKFNNWEIIK